MKRKKRIGSFEARARQLQRQIKHSTARRLASRDADAPYCGKDKTSRIDLGLALLSRVALPGICYTTQEIAVWCGCTNSAVFQIEQSALRKVRNHLLFRDKKAAEELMEALHAATKRKRNDWDLLQGR